MNHRLAMRSTCAFVFALVLCLSRAAWGDQPRLYQQFDYKEPADKTPREVRITIPQGLATVRGILVVSNGMGADSREMYKEAWYGEFLFLHDFAFLGARGFDSHTESLNAMLNALKKIAADSKHPELIDAPLVTTGFSAGGGFASRLLVEAPDRVIASVPVSSRLNFTGTTPSVANMGTPACIICGEKEVKLPETIDPVLKDCRPKGALFAWMTVQGGEHARSGQEVLAMPILDAAVRLRYPRDADVHKGPVKLKTLDPNSGWVADNTTWKSGLTTIAPAGQFKGDIEKSSWLLTEDIAFIYRAYATYDRPLTISAVPQAGGQAGDKLLVLDSGAGAVIMADVSKFPDWKTLEFYDGAHKLGEVAKAPAQFTAAKLPPGYHVFSVLATDDKGVMRTSNPLLVIARKLPGKD